MNVVRFRSRSSAIPLLVGLYTVRRNVPGLRRVVPSPWVLARLELGRMIETRAAEKRRRRRRFLVGSLAAGIAVAAVAGAAAKRSGSDISDDDPIDF
jgi:hypothetical protein